MNVIQALQECKTPAEFHRIRITIENLLTPAEFVGLIRMSDQFPVPVRERFKTFEIAMLSGNDKIQNFRRTPVGANIDFFESAGEGFPAKTLLLHFCGIYPFRPLGLPTAIFLQYVPANRFDVLVLRDPSAHFFLTGVPDFADSIVALVHKIEQQFPIKKYRSIRSSGICAGGYAALVTGELLNAECAVSFAGAHPTRAQSFESFRAAGLDGYEADVMLGNMNRSQKIRMSNIYAKGNAWDKDRAQSLTPTFPLLRHVEVATTHSHLLAAELLQRNELKHLLDQTLTGTLDASHSAQAQ